MLVFSSEYYCSVYICEYKLNIFINLTNWLSVNTLVTQYVVSIYKLTYSCG